MHILALPSFRTVFEGAGTDACVPRAGGEVRSPQQNLLPTSDVREKLCNLNVKYIRLRVYPDRAKTKTKIFFDVLPPIL